ncbi:TPA: hypothetical protein ACH3X1_012376 [Trebouxia sp. C0004]
MQLDVWRSTLCAWLLNLAFFNFHMRFTISTARYRVITWSASLGITLSGLTDEGADERQDTGRSLRSTVAGYARRYYGPERLVAADARARVAENAGAGTNADRPAPAQPAAARRTGTMREVAATSAQVTASSSGLHTSTGLADSPAPSLQPSTYLSTLLNASLSPITHSAYANLRESDSLTAQHFRAQQAQTPQALSLRQ